MSRKSSLLHCSAVVALAFCVSAQSQDSQNNSPNPPSLGDVARQTRNQNNSATPHKIITNDEVSPNSGIGILGVKQADSGGESASGSATPSGPDLEKAEAAVASLEKMDRAALVKLALQGNDVNFPGRAAWEQRLVSAKQDYVAQVRDLLREARQLEAEGKSLAASRASQGPPNDDDPAVIRYKARFKDLTQNAVRIDAAFQAIIMEGRNRATEAAAH